MFPLFTLDLSDSSLLGASQSIAEDWCLRSSGCKVLLRKTLEGRMEGGGSFSGVCGVGWEVEGGGKWGWDPSLPFKAGSPGGM